MLLIFLDLCSSLESPTPCFCLNLYNFYFYVVVWGVKKYLFDLLLKVDDKLDLYNEHESESQNIFLVLYKRKEGEGGSWVGGEWEGEL